MAWWLKLRRRRRLEKDLDDEIAFHRAMRAGDRDAPPFGNETRIRETTRELWRFGGIETTWQDVRYALRVLRRQPGFTLVIVLTLALGIGANTAVFSVVNGVVLRPLPYPEPQRLELVVTTFPTLGFDRFGLSLPEFLELRAHARAYESIGAYTGRTVTLASPAPSRQNGAAVTSDLLPTLGVGPVLGRAFDEADSRPGADPVAILSFELWQRELGGDPAIVGRPVDINGTATRVVGVMPRGFDVHDRKIALWLPLTVNPATLSRVRSDHYLNVIGRRRSGVAPEQARDDLNRLLASWRGIVPQGHIPVDPAHRIAAASLVDDLVGDVRGTLWTLQGAVGLVLLIACVNLANLLIARADSRAHEHALRVALGASRWRLLRQTITEGLLLAGVAAALGLALAQSALGLLLSTYPDALPRVDEIAVDWRVLVFTAGVTLLVAVVFGLVPLGRLAKERLGDALKLGSHRLAGGAARARVRTALIVSEVALAVLLVTGAGLLLRSFINLTRVDVGVERSGLSMFATGLPGARYDAAARAQFFERLLASVRAIPGVDRAATMTGLPTHRDVWATDTDFAHIANDRPSNQGPAENVDYYETVSIDFVATLGARVAAGRGFQPGDAGGAAVVMVNEALVRKFFDGRDPIGQQLRPRAFGRDVPWFTIVGVLKDIKHDGVAAGAGTEVYFLAEQLVRLTDSAPGSVYVAVRSALPLATLAPQFRRAVSELDPTLPVTEMQTMDEAIGTAIARPQFLLLLVGLMAGLALVLATVGLYGVLAYLVAERQQEIGVRVALGATRQDVMRLVIVRGLGATLAGIACGLLAAASLSHVLAALLFEVAPTDPATLAGVAAVMLLTAAVACVVPAWRASRVDPLTALRA